MDFSSQSDRTTVTALNQSKPNIAPAAKGADSVDTQVIAVASGKGGVGKTAVSVNLAVAIAQLGRKVLLLDADLALGDVGLLLGLQPHHSLGDVLTGRCSLEEALIDGPGGILVLPAACGDEAMTNLGGGHYSGLFGALAAPPADSDVLIIDTAAGLGRNVTSFVAASQEVVVVVRDEPASIADASALMRALASEYKRDRFHLLVNGAGGHDHARQVLGKVYGRCDSLTCIRLDLMGWIPQDANLCQAAHQGRAICEAYPGSPAAQAFAELAAVVDAWPRQPLPSGNTEFFLEKLVMNGRLNNEEAA